MTEGSTTPIVATKVCPHCAVQSQTNAKKCPSCGKSYKVKRRLGCSGCLGITFLIVVIVIIASVAVHKSGNGTVKATSVTGKVAGTFVRTGAWAPGPLASKILTSHTYCGWSGKNVIVHVTMRNTSAEKVTVHWHPSYSIVNGAPHGTGLTSIKDTGLKPGQTKSVFISEPPAGVTAGTRIARCYPSFNNVMSG